MEIENGARPSTSDDEIADDLTPGLPAHPHPETAVAAIAAAVALGAPTAPVATPPTPATGTTAKVAPRRCQRCHLSCQVRRRHT